MIEAMKKVTVFSLSENRESTISKLRDMGIVHIESLKTRSLGALSAESKRSEIEQVLKEIDEHKGKKEKIEKKNMEKNFDEVQSYLFSLLDEKKRILSDQSSLMFEIERLLPFGSLDPLLVESLKNEGFDLHFYIIDGKEYEKIKDDDSFTSIPLRNGKSMVIATLNSTIKPSLGALEFDIGKRSLDDLKKEYDLNALRLKEIEETFSSFIPYEGAWLEKLGEKDDEIMFENVKDTALQDGEVLYITGYIPEKTLKEFKEDAKNAKLAYAIFDISDEDEPPTLVRYNRISRFIAPVFKILGVVPGYREYDISTYFLLFFSLFFAMILGDAGYGLIMLIAAIVMNVKSKKATDVNILLYILSITTILWGAVTGTYFGSEAVLKAFPVLQKFIIPEITNFPDLLGVDSDYAQNMVMKFCFMLGAIQLSLACVLNIIHKVPKKDLSWVADLGWLIDIVLLYLLVLYLVIGQSAPFKLIVAGVATGFVLVCCFGAQESGLDFITGLKRSLGGFFTTFLNTVSAFSNIMSYIRLFAVGMASLAIAQSFNDMGAGFMPLGILVIILGHVLNLVMGMLSVVVHGVRLNLLEFSGQLGMEWSGYEYEPFKKGAKTKN